MKVSLLRQDFTFADAIFRITSTFWKKNILKAVEFHLYGFPVNIDFPM